MYNLNLRKGDAIEIIKGVQDCFCSEEVSARRFEELEDGLVLPYGRVCDIDYDLCSGQCFIQTFSCNGVDARGGRARHNFRQPDPM